MAGFTSVLEEALEAWSDTRLGLIEEVQNIPARSFDFRPAAGVRSIRDQVVHVLEVAMMMTEELTRPETNFQRTSWPDLLRPHTRRAEAARTKAQLVALLRSQLREGEARFRKAGELHMLQFLVRFDGERGTRLAWLHHGIAQEMYHRGQLTLYQRLLGLEPALTRRIRGG